LRVNRKCHGLGRNDFIAWALTTALTAIHLLSAVKRLTLCQEMTKKLLGNFQDSILLAILNHNFLIVIGLLRQKRVYVRQRMITFLTLVTLQAKFHYCQSTMTIFSADSSVSSSLIQTWKMKYNL
jgi:hypothetical protein